MTGPSIGEVPFGVPWSLAMVRILISLKGEAEVEDVSEWASLELLREVVGVIALGKERTAPNPNKYWLSVYYKKCAGIKEFIFQIWPQ